MANNFEVYHTFELVIILFSPFEHIATYAIHVSLLKNMLKREYYYLFPLDGNILLDYQLKLYFSTGVTIITL